MTRQERVKCGICAQRCAPGDRVSVELRLATGGTQHFFVHWQCLRTAVHPEVVLHDVDDYQHVLTPVPEQPPT